MQWLRKKVRACGTCFLGEVKKGSVKKGFIQVPCIIKKMKKKKMGSLQIEEVKNVVAVLYIFSFSFSPHSFSFLDPIRNHYAGY